MAEEQDEKLVNIDIGHYVEVLKKHVLTLLFVVTLFGLIGTSISLAWPDSFEAETSVVLKQRELIDDSALARSTKEITPMIQARVLATELRSRRFIEGTLESLDWTEYADARVQGQLAHSMFIRKVQDPKHLSIDLTPDGKGSMLVVIRFSWSDPKKAQELVLRLREYWIENLIEDHTSEILNQLTKMNLQIDAKKKDLTEAEEKLVSFLYDHPELPIGDGEHPGIARENALIDRIAEVEAEQKEVEQQLIELESLLRTTPEEEEIHTKERNPEFVDGALRYQQALKSIEGYKAEGYTDQHPKMVRAKEGLQRAQRSLVGLEEYVVNEITTVKNQAYQALRVSVNQKNVSREGLSGKIEELKLDLDRVRAANKEVPAFMGELSSLKNEVSILRDIVNKKVMEREPTTDRYQSLSKFDPYSEAPGRGSLSSALQILNEPELDPDPDKPLAAIIIIGAILFGMSSASVWLIARELLKDTYVSAQDVRRSLSLPILGAIGPIVTELEVRRERMQRFVATAASLLFLIAFASAIYVCAFHPDVIPPELRNTVTSFTEGLG